jgi:hypothetical protein
MYLHAFFATSENVLIEIKIRLITMLIKILSLMEHVFVCYVYWHIVDFF